MGPGNFFERLGRHLSFVYNQILQYPVQSTFIAANILIVVGGAIACRRSYRRSLKKDVPAQRERKKRKKKRRYYPTKHSCPSESSNLSTVVDLDTEDDRTNQSVLSYDLHAISDRGSDSKHQEPASSNSSTCSKSTCVDIQSESSSSSECEEGSTSSSWVSTSQKSKADSQQRRIYNPVRRLSPRSPYTYNQPLPYFVRQCPKQSSSTQTESKWRAGIKSATTQTNGKKNSSAQTVDVKKHVISAQNMHRHNMANYDRCGDSNESEHSWYRPWRVPRTPKHVDFRNMKTEPPKCKHSCDRRKDCNSFYRGTENQKTYHQINNGAQPKNTIFGISLKPVCNSETDERNLVRNFSPDLSNFSVSPRRN